LKKLYLALAAFLFGADGMCKEIVERTQPDGEVTRIFGGRLLLRKHHNTGAMFGIGAARQQTTALLSLAFMTFMLGVFVATLGTRGNHLLKSGLSLILGGAFSNTYDRLARGYVVDYLSLPVRNARIRRLVFNLSDVAIIVGSCLLVLSQIKKEP